MTNGQRSFFERARTSVGETTRKVSEKAVKAGREHGVYVFGVASGVVIAIHGIKGKTPRETLSERFRRYVQIAVGYTIAAGSIVADLYDKNVFNLRDRFEVGMPYIHRRNADA